MLARSSLDPRAQFVLAELGSRRRSGATRLGVGSGLAILAGASGAPFGRPGLRSTVNGFLADAASAGRAMRLVSFPSTYESVACRPAPGAIVSVAAVSPRGHPSPAWPD